VTDAVLQVRTAVRRFLDEVGVRCGCVAVACSGGADSLALADATVHYGQRKDLQVYGLVVDHGLQPDSAAVAADAAAQLAKIGCTDTRVLAVHVPAGGNVEAAARKARYHALHAARPHPDALVLLGHTLDDQAETVLLGLGRGSGPRSIAGMRELDPPWARPLLGIRRATTQAACQSLGLTPWQDPHNTDPRFRRARLRAEVLPLLEEVLAGGVAQALTRTAAQLREDGDALDAIAAELYRRSRIDDGALDVTTLHRAPGALRRRVIRSWLLDGGVTELSDAHLRAVDALVGVWRGQGGVALPGLLEAHRARGRLLLTRQPGAFRPV
jgi:tRNA(Ile)-lysidine synthase